MNAHPLSLIDDNEDNSSQTYISSVKPKKSLKEDDVSTENTLKNNNKYIFKEKQMNLNNKARNPKNQRIVFDFKNKFIKDNSSSDNNKTSDMNTKPGLIDDTNDEPKKEKIKDDKINENKIQESTNVPKDKLAKNLLEKRDKRFSYHGKIYFCLAISMLIYQYLSYIYLIEFPIIQRK